MTWQLLGSMASQDAGELMQLGCSMDMAFRQAASAYKLRSRQSGVACDMFGIVFRSSLAVFSF